MTRDALSRLAHRLRPSRRRPAAATTPTSAPAGDSTGTRSEESIGVGQDTGQDPDQVRAYWTPERAAGARPREQRRDP